jgi:hypothetical protein
VPAPLVCLRDEPGGTVIDLPFLSDQRNLWFQTVHGHPILGGMLVKKAAFGSGEVERLRAENDFLDLLLDLGEIQLRRDTRFDEADKRSLVEAGYRWVVVDKTRFEGAAAGRQGSALSGSVWPRVERLLRPAIGDPAAEDEQVAVYSLGGSRLTCPP